MLYIICLEMYNLKIFMLMKNQITWGVFFIVPMTFITSIVKPDIVEHFIVPIGCLAALFVFIIDLFCEKLFIKEQVFKFFCYALLSIRFGQLYDFQLITDIGMGVALLCSLAMVIFFSLKMDGLADECRKLDGD